MFLANQILQGDCTELLQFLPDGGIDFVLTDPPYLARYRDRYGRTLANDDNPAGVVGAYAELYRVLKNDAFCLTFYGYPRLHDFVEAWTNAGFDTVAHLVWPKSYASSSRFVRVAHESAYLLAKGRPQKPREPLWSVQQTWAYTGNQAHPTMKPVRALCPLIEAFSRPGDLVLDPFAAPVRASSLRRRWDGDISASSLNPDTVQWRGSVLLVSAKLPSELRDLHSLGRALRALSRFFPV